MYPLYSPHKVTPQHEQTLTLSLQLTIDLFPPTSLCTSERLPLEAALTRSCPDIYTHHRHHHHTKLTLTSLLHLHRLLLSSHSQKSTASNYPLSHAPHTHPHSLRTLPTRLRTCPTPSVPAPYLHTPTHAPSTPSAHRPLLRHLLNFHTPSLRPPSLPHA